MEIRIKQMLEKPEETDGYRILVERNLPEGLDELNVQADLWLKRLSPSDELAAWYNHDTSKWEEFKRRYTKELEPNLSNIQFLIDDAREEGLTLLYNGGDPEHNYAAALRDFIESNFLIVEEP